jgi:site-specific DNA-methyltransferase (adenine-specific)
MTTAPYYQDDHVTLYHGDCLKLADVWTGADVLVTDPPYGVAHAPFVRRKGAQKWERIAGDADTGARDAALASWGDGPAIVFGKWTQPRPAGTRARLIWDKRPCGFTGDLAMPWGATEEEIYVLGRGFTGKRRPNVISVPTLMSGDANRPDHPTPKPVGLMEHLISYSPPGVIADPFAGSGSTLVAARNLGRTAIGVELEERYCELIAQRLSQGALDLNI